MSTASQTGSGPPPPVLRGAVFPQTKFHRPEVRSEHVERGALLDAIDRSGARVVVVDAPAGFGKSTLLSQWADRAVEGDPSDPGPHRVAWVSLDPDDAGVRLWSAILAALRPLVGDALDQAMEAAESPDADLRDDVLVPVLDVLESAGPLALILDDLHLVLDDRRARDSLDWVLGRLPSTHAVLIATRRDPALESLRRMRIHGELLDVRTEDLRFGTDEAGRFLRDGLGLELGPDDVAILDGRIEGWPAALYLAALRLRMGDSVANVMERLHERDEELFGDLADEVLRAWPPAERRFVRETAVLNRFTVDLCVRLLGDDEETRGAFRTLTRTSLLLTPLDGTRTWFRSHHLMRDVLRSRLLTEDPARARELHVRAGEWFETEGGESELYEAMHHYLEAREWDLAAELLTCHSIRFVQSGALGGRARDWMVKFPPDVVRTDPRLCFVAALLAALDGDRDGRDAWLDDGGRGGWVGPMPDGTASFDLAAEWAAALVCFDDLGAASAAAERALEALPPGAPVRSAVEALAAWHAHVAGRGAEAVALAERARRAHVQLPAAGLPLVDYLPQAVLALEAAGRGDLGEAEAQAASAVLGRDDGPLRRAPHALPVACAQARAATLAGRPADAVAVCTAALELVRGWRDSSLMVPAVLLELARAHAADGDPDSARSAAERGLRRIADARDAGALPRELERVLAQVGGTPGQGLAGVPGVEELSAREVGVLRALAGSGSLRELADSLYISRNTIKTHTRSLYAKLGVASREEAVQRGRALGLLGGSSGNGRDHQQDPGRDRP
ncbi:LuxR C-terminal-related transcriptional regulator [Patulibacter minatonensis]|uniref:LuxR C-terminal-related transcriptional regulator n=1 Tax=Patulibacter minatonensis TaxID=298163 RepID=UPI0004790020|nr:LuxR C-terminal-related transcriptional regulator [Patulibacter minatonensis]